MLLETDFEQPPARIAAKAVVPANDRNIFIKLRKELSVRVRLKVLLRLSSEHTMTVISCLPLGRTNLPHRFALRSQFPGETFVAIMTRSFPRIQPTPQHVDLLFRTAKNTDGPDRSRTFRFNAWPANSRRPLRLGLRPSSVWHHACALAQSD